MSSDIVERLGDLADINEGDPAMLPSESKILREAADEIQRLRAELSKKIEELAAMKRQRDEAQKEVCRYWSMRSVQLFGVHRSPKEHAAKRGWDCYAEKEGVES